MRLQMDGLPHRGAGSRRPYLFKVWCNSKPLALTENRMIEKPTWSPSAKFFSKRVLKEIRDKIFFSLSPEELTELFSKAKAEHDCQRIARKNPIAP